MMLAAHYLEVHVLEKVLHGSHLAKLAAKPFLQRLGGFGVWAVGWGDWVRNLCLWIRTHMTTATKHSVYPL